MPKRLNAGIFLSGMLLITMLLSACALQPKEPVTKTGFYFDTAVTLTVYETPSHMDKAEELLQKAMDECARYDALFAPDNEESEIYRINHAGGQSVMVSDETRDLLYAALAYSRSFSQCVDLTIEPVWELWDFSGESEYVPQKADLKAALQHVNYENLSIDGNKVTLSDPNAAVNVGFIAKGYIADQLKDFLTKEGCESAIINLGGNVQTIGMKPDKSPYSVGIQKPFANTGEYLTTTDLGSGDNLYSSAATSGVYERCFEKDGILYHHILDLETGMPVDTDLYSATILTDSSLDADVLSTVCLIMGKDAAVSLIRNTADVDAILITKENEVIDTR